MKETLQFNLHHLFTKICQIKPHSVLYQQNSCYTSTEVQSYQHHKMLFTSTSIYSHLGAEIVSKHLWFWPSEQFWYQRYLPSVQKENIIAWFITVIWIKKYWKLLSEKIIIPLLRLIFLNYMNQTLKPLGFQSLTTFCEERADIIFITSKMRLLQSNAMYFNLWVCMVWKILVK